MKNIFDRYNSWGIETRGTLLFAIFVSNVVSVILHPIIFSLVYYDLIIFGIVLFSIISWLGLMYLSKNMRIQERTLLSILIIGPFVVSILLWTNYLTALIHSSNETHVIAKFTKKRHEGGGPEYLPDKYLIDFKDSAMKDFERIRTYSPEDVGAVIESITYRTGTGILGIKVIFKTVFNSPKS